VARVSPDEVALTERVSRLHPHAVDDLRTLVRIPSVSADPSHVDDVHAAAQAVVSMARAAGADEATVLAVPGGRPAVVARWEPPPGAPTVLLYAHHDVQPAPAEAWETDPFDPVEREGRLYGRGAADDKAGVVAHLAAVRAHGGRPPTGVTLFVEGEEEVGSPTFGEFLAEHRALLAADVLVVADSMNWSPDVPALTTTLRGLVEVDVEVRTLARAAHSGMGGAAPDALTALAHVLASLHTADGKVAVPGLVAGTRPGPDLDATRWRDDTGVLDGVSLLGRGPLTDRLWMQPSVAVLAVDAPGLAEAANVLVPSARARVSMRIAPGQDPATAQAALRDHLVAAAPWGAHVEVVDGATGRPVSLGASSRAAGVAQRCLRDAFGHDPVQIGVGGSIPFIAELAESYPDAVILVTGAGDPEASWHGPNENLHLGMFARTCAFEALLLHRLAQQG
jgi:acetylornithine deacetylase/succinyl-diaminopimelate desuccinylase-like protein